jgi:putative FmdB family regulatory protein
MPTYPYRCLQCGHEFELFQKITEEAVKDCPSCKTKGEVQRQIGGGSALLRFEGSGFYETDYKRKPETPAPKRGCGCGKPHGSCGSEK